MPSTAVEAWWRRHVLAIPIGYALVMASWVTLSDDLITREVHDPIAIHRLEIEKDLLFVGLTAVLLFIGIRAVVERMQADAHQRLDSEQRLTAELRRLTDRLAQAREEEQARIARDLHDDLGQLVTALSLSLRTGERLAAGLPPGPAATAVVEMNRNAGELAGHVLAAIQRIARDLHPFTLEGLDLETALRRELRWVGNHVGFHGALRVEGSLQRLPNRIAAALYRIGQEAITNVARHAEAGRVDVALRVEDGVAVLEVEDDGRGIDPENAPSLGLIGMRERAAALGGDLAVRPGLTKGTVLAARIPLTAPEQGEAT